MLEYRPKDQPGTHWLHSSPRTLKLSCWLVTIPVSVRVACTYVIKIRELPLHVGIIWDREKRKSWGKALTHWKDVCIYASPMKHAKNMLLFYRVAIIFQGFWRMSLPVFTLWLIGIAQNYNSCLRDNWNSFQTVFFKGWEVSACKFSDADLGGNLFWEIGFILLHERRELCAGVMMLNTFLKPSHSFPPNLSSFESLYNYIAFSLENLWMWNRTFQVQHNLATFNCCYLEFFFLNFTFRQTGCVSWLSLWVKMCHM